MVAVMTDNFFSNNDSNFYWFFGCVEDRDDPMRIGRVKLRILGYHTDDKEQLPTDDLPWAMPIMPANSASTSGIGWSPTGPVEGTWVWGFFMDGAEGQQPAFVGTINAVPESNGSGGGSGDGSGNSPTSGGSGGAGDGGKVDPAELAKLSNCDCTTLAKSQMARGNKANMQVIIKAGQSAGYPPKAIAGLLAIAGVECGFVPVNEDTRYTNVSVLKKEFSNVYNHPNPDAFARAIVAGGSVACANAIYGGRGGNAKTIPNTGSLVSTDKNQDGYKYRGRGFNQLTFKSNYAALGKAIGMGNQLVANPDLVNTIEVAAKVLTQFYFTAGLKKSQLNDDNIGGRLIKLTGNDMKGGKGPTSHEQKAALYKCFMENYTKNGNFI
jgi:predicted chitinase